MKLTQLLDKLKDLQKGLDQPMTSPFGPIYPIVQYDEFTKLLPIVYKVIETQREALEKIHKETGLQEESGDALDWALAHSTRIDYVIADIVRQAIAQCEKVIQEEME